MATSNLCRICLTERTNLDNMNPLFDKSPCSLEILQRIEECGGIVLEPKQMFPRMICDDCVKSLNSSYKFRTLCQSSEITLLKILVTTKSEIKDEPENSDNEADILFNEIIETEEIESEILLEQYDNDSLHAPYQEEISDFLISDQEFKDNDEQNKKSIVSNNIKPRRKNWQSLTVILDNTSDQQKRERNKRLKKDQNMCEICGNIYSKRFLLKSHMRVHTDDKPFECEICNKSFARSSQVRRHMRVHTGKKPFVCKFCGRAFGDQSTHIKHERIHTKERPFRCNTCGKSFTYSGVLKNHMLTHTGEKAFSCIPCNKRFTLKHQLEQHNATITHLQTVG